MAKKKTNGYIKISRDFMHHPLYTNGMAFTLKEVLIDLNLRAFYQDTQKTYKNTLNTYLRGQVEGSYRQFAEWWCMSKDTVDNRLNALEEGGYIYRTSLQGRTVINLLNYCAEQDNSGLGSDTNQDTNQDTDKDRGSDTKRDTDSDNYKKDKEINKKSLKNQKEKRSARSDFFVEE